MRIPVVYKIENIITKDCYFGSSTNYSKRVTEHKYDLRHGGHHSAYLQNAWNKYGEDNFNFEIVKEYINSASNKDLKEKEQNYIDKHKPAYNMNPTASGWHNELVPVVQLSVTDKIIKYFPSQMAANLHLGLDPYNVGITSMIYGRQKSAHGFKWVRNTYRKTEKVLIEESKLRSNGISAIQQLDPITGEVINEGFPQTFTDLGFDTSAISKVINGEYNHHKGFIFRKYDPFPTKKYFLGVDSGKNGAFAIIDIEGKLIFRTPIFIDDMNEYDLVRMSSYIRDIKDYLYCGALEEVHSIFGTSKSTAFKMGLGLGILKGLFAANDIYIMSPTPKEWQKEVWPLVPKQVDNKKTSLLVGKLLFPGNDFLASSRSRVPHDGIVDAALIAYYCKLKFFNQ